MRYLYVSMMINLSLLTPVTAQDSVPKRKVSDKPLNAEQIAVYRAVLEDYMKSAEGGLNLSNETAPLDPTSLNNSCTNLSTQSDSQDLGQTVHLLDSTVLLNQKIVLVDPTRQQTQIRENDPQRLMKKAIDGHAEVTNKEVETSVKNAFATGLFTLSEIVFDKEHHRAVVAYSFFCGSLCGQGNTLVVMKLGQKWKVTKRCGGWVS